MGSVFGQSRNPQARDFYVRFWGVRGSIACSGPSCVSYGGNTSCIEIACGERRLIFDLGTGVRYLGNELARSTPLDMDIFLSHTHYDHVCGVPFFGPFYDPRNRFRIHAGKPGPRASIHGTLCDLMRAPFFPVPLTICKANLEFRDFDVGQTLRLDEKIEIRTAPLNHPNGATGYRVNYDSRSVCYLTDTEHVPGQPDLNILSLIDKADIVIYDSMFTDEEFSSRVGWGHSTWREGATLCDMANVKKFVAFHHDPDHDDQTMDQIARDLKKFRPSSVVAQEGMVLYP